MKEKIIDRDYSPHPSIDWNPPFDEGDYIFTNNPTKQMLQQAETDCKILIGYSSNVDELLKVRKELRSSSHLILWLDQGPYTLKDGRVLKFKEFMLDNLKRICEVKLQGFTY